MALEAKSIIGSDNTQILKNKIINLLVSICMATGDESGAHDFLKDIL